MSVGMLTLDNDNDIEESDIPVGNEQEEQIMPKPRHFEDVKADKTQKRKYN